MCIAFPSGDLFDPCWLHSTEDTILIAPNFTHPQSLVKSGSMRKHVLHDVPIQLHLLHLLHQPEDASLEVGLETDVVLKNERFVHLHVHHLRRAEDFPSLELSFLFTCNLFKMPHIAVNCIWTIL